MLILYFNFYFLFLTYFQLRLANKKEKKPKAVIENVSKKAKKKENKNNLEQHQEDSNEEDDIKDSNMLPKEPITTGQTSEPVTQSEKELVSAANDTKKKKQNKDKENHEKIPKNETTQKETLSKKKVNDDQRLKLYNENLERQMVHN